MHLQKILLQNNMQLVKKNKKLNKGEYVTYIRVNDLTEYNQEKLKEYGLINAIYVYVGKTNNLSKRDCNFNLRLEDKLSGKNKDNKANMDNDVVGALSSIKKFYMKELRLTEKEAYYKTMKENKYISDDIMTNKEAMAKEKQIQKQLQIAMIQNALGIAGGKEVILINNFGVPYSVKNDNDTLKVSMTKKEAKEQSKKLCDKLTEMLQVMYNSDDYGFIQEGKKTLVKIKNTRDLGNECLKVKY